MPARPISFHQHIFQGKKKERKKKRVIIIIYKYRNRVFMLRIWFIRFLAGCCGGFTIRPPIPHYLKMYIVLEFVYGVDYAGPVDSYIPLPGSLLLPCCFIHGVGGCCWKRRSCPMVVIVGGHHDHRLCTSRSQHRARQRKRVQQQQQQRRRYRLKIIHCGSFGRYSIRRVPYRRPSERRRRRCVYNLLVRHVVMTVIIVRPLPGFCFDLSHCPRVGDPSF